jgi:polysaccharide biosynthesis transport protein
MACYLRYSMAQDSRYREANLLHYWFLLRKRLFHVGGFAAILVTTVIIGTLLMPKWYSSTATIEINPKAPTILNVTEVSDLVSVKTNDERHAYYATQYKILKSRTVVEATLDRLAEEHGIHDFDEADDRIRAFKKHLELRPEGDTELVHVTYEYTDPDKAALFANTLAEVYMSRNLDRARNDANEARDRLEEQREDYLQRKLESERKVHDYKFEHNLVGVSDRKTGVEERLNSLQMELSDASSERLTMDSDSSRLRQLERSQDWLGLANHLASSNPVLQSSLESLASLREERMSLESRYKASMPVMEDLDNKIAGQEKLVRRQLDEYIGGREASLALAKDREQALKAEVEQLTIEFEGLNEKAIELAFLESQANQDEQFFSELDKRVAEVTLTNLIRANNVSFVDMAFVRDEPVRPLLITNVPIALVVGLLAGIAMAFAMEYVDGTVKTREDIEEEVGLPFLGAVPQLADAETELLSDFERNLYAHTRPRAPATECLRSIRTNILFRSEKPIRRLLVTSAAPQEGKSFISSNLSAVIAMTGTRILIIDADLRRPMQHKQFDVPNVNGLTDVLAGRMTLDEAIQRTPVENLDLLVAGPHPDNPAELLGSDLMHRLLDNISGYDMVLIDSPPVSAVADPLILSRVVDGIVMVVRTNKTAKKLVVQCRSRLAEMDANVLGAIVNCLDIRREGYGYYYYYDYNSVYYADPAEEREAANSK